MNKKQLQIFQYSRGEEKVLKDLQLFLGFRRNLRPNRDPRSYKPVLWIRYIPDRDL